MRGDEVLFNNVINLLGVFFKIWLEIKFSSTVIFNSADFCTGESSRGNVTAYRS